MLAKKNVLYTLMKAKANGYVNQVISEDFKPFIEHEYELKQSLLRKRKVEVVKCTVKGAIHNVQNENEETTVTYHVHKRFLCKQDDLFYVEEDIEERCALFYKDTLIHDKLLPIHIDEIDDLEFIIDDKEEVANRNGYYNRLAAVQYAETYWNTPNPAYKYFEVNCTNYISQCLRAGKAPMRGQHNRSKGWWLSKDNWSYSWAVAHSMHSYLQSSKQGLRAIKKSSVKELAMGDVICYDFEGDGRWNHTTIVVAKDADGMPLVNANTYNSRMRYWAYEDSTAYTPNIKYAFFHITDQ
ncbi:amidase domain-containing protein [Priestia flexa]|uniref:amidase domain-containing protein n=1 Tax=Priestia flexa TaxID=86664 RepID=UPI0021FB5322|nr:amidase domain-containing protein [Bacillus sp. 1780r2a1]